MIRRVTAEIFPLGLRAAPRQVSEEEFDAIFGRVRAAGLTYGSGPFTAEDGQINHWRGGRGVYFRDPNGHLLELLTVT